MLIQRVRSKVLLVMEEIREQVVPEARAVLV
jgi:hypothetical protein